MQELSAERHSRMEAEKLVAELRQRLDNLRNSRQPAASGKKPATTSGKIDRSSGSGPTVAAAALAPAAPVTQDQGQGDAHQEGVQQREVLAAVPAAPLAASAGRKSGSGSPRKSGKRAATGKAAGPSKGFGK